MFRRAKRIRMDIRGLIALFLLTSSCTVHVPFQSEKDKAAYHLERAAEHDPTLLDSTTTLLTIPSKSLNIDFASDINTEGRPCFYISSPRAFYDTITNTEVVLVQDTTTGGLNVGVEVGEQKIPCDCPPQTVIMKGVPSWMWFLLMALIFAVCIMFLLLRATR